MRVVLHDSVNPLYIDTFYGSKILYSDSYIFTNESVQIEFDFITTEFSLISIFGG